MADFSLPTLAEVMAAQDRRMAKLRESTDPEIVAQLAEYDAALLASAQRLADWIDAQCYQEVRRQMAAGEPPYDGNLEDKSVQ